MTDKIVYVEWIDSSSNHGWCDAGDAAVHDLRCVSIGFLIAENDASITVAASQCVPTGSVDAPITIPLVAITNLYEVRWVT